MTWQEMKALWQHRRKPWHKSVLIGLPYYYRGDMKIVGKVYSTSRTDSTSYLQFLSPDSGVVGYDYITGRFRVYKAGKKTWHSKRGS